MEFKLSTKVESKKVESKKESFPTSIELPVNGKLVSFKLSPKQDVKKYPNSRVYFPPFGSDRIVNLESDTLDVALSVSHVIVTKK